jgi:hypothetical protein
MMMPSLSGVMRALLVAALLLPAAGLGAQQGRPEADPLAELRIHVTDEEHAAVAGSGVLPFDRQGLIATVSVADSLDNFRRGGRVRWSTSDPNVVSIYDDPSSRTVRVVAQADGRAMLTATVGGRTVSIPVFVGAARREITAADLAPRFRVARLEIVAEKGSAGAELEAAEGRLRVRENGHGGMLRVRAFAADGSPIPLEHFPVTWGNAQDKVVELSQAGTHETQLVAREPGSTRISASVQGVTATVDAEVITGNVPLRTFGGAQVVARANGPSVKPSSDLPITVKPSKDLPITVKPAAPKPPTRD